MIEDGLREVKDLSKYTWARPAKESLRAVKGLCQTTWSEEDSMMAALRVERLASEDCNHGVSKSEGTRLEAVRDGKEKGAVKLSESDWLLENSCWSIEEEGRKKAFSGGRKYDGEALTE